MGEEKSAISSVEEKCHRKSGSGSNTKMMVDGHKIIENLHICDIISSLCCYVCNNGAIYNKVQYILLMYTL